MPQRPAVDVAVLMRKERVPAGLDRWQQWRWVLAEVMPQEEGFGDQARLLRKGDEGEIWLHPGFRVELFRDDAEGYYLNLTTPAPCWFVLWRMEEEASVGSQPLAIPAMVSLSYHDAGRWLDAQETVEQCPAPPEVLSWLRTFTDEHYTLEPKRRKRPESFRPLQDRFGKPASVSTEKKFGTGHGQ